MKKLFSFDLDGTLLNNEGSIFIENIEAIENKLIDTVDFKDVFTDAFSEG